MRRKLSGCFFYTILVGAAMVTGDQKPVTPLQKLRAEDAGARKAAKKQIIKEYTDTVRGLEGIIKDCLRGDYKQALRAGIDKGKVEARYLAAGAAMQLLGELRSAGSVRLLASHLSFSITQGRVRWKLPTLENDYPAAAALVKIGLPSLPAVVDAYVRERKKTRFQTLQIFRKVLGKGCGKQYLKERLAEAKDPDRQRRLTELLKALSA